MRQYTISNAVIILDHAIGSKISPAFRISISLPYHWTLGDALQRGGIIGQHSADHYLVRTRSFVIVSQEKQKIHGYIGMYLPGASRSTEILPRYFMRG